MKNIICMILGAAALVGCSRDRHSAMNGSDSNTYSSSRSANEAAGAQNSVLTESSNGTYDSSATGNPAGKSGTGTAIQGTR